LPLLSCFLVFLLFLLIINSLSLSYIRTQTIVKGKECINFLIFSCLTLFWWLLSSFHQVTDIYWNSFENIVYPVILFTSHFKFQNTNMLYGMKTNWCHYFIRILLDLYMFWAHRRVRTAVHTTIGSVYVLCEQLSKLSWRWAFGPETCRDPAIYE